MDYLAQLGASSGAMTEDYEGVCPRGTGGDGGATFEERPDTDVWHLHTAKIKKCSDMIIDLNLPPPDPAPRRPTTDGRDGSTPQGAVARRPFFNQEVMIKHNTKLRTPQKEAYRKIQKYATEANEVYVKRVREFLSPSIC